MADRRFDLVLRAQSDADLRFELLDSDGRAILGRTGSGKKSVAPWDRIRSDVPPQESPDRNQEQRKQQTHGDFSGVTERMASLRIVHRSPRGDPVVHDPHPPF